MCQDYQLRVTAQDICNNQSAVQTIYWPRIHNVNVIQISNVVTNNDDGFNECWEAIVEGAEYYEYVIYDLYGDILYHVTNSIHCPDQNIVTLWCPEDYPEEGSQVFWYVISFWNSCGSSETHQGTIEYFNMLKTPVSDMMQNSDLTHQGKLHVSQNPNSANVYVNCPENLQKITSIDIYNATGQLVRSETDYSLEILNKATIILNTTKLSPGIYFIRLTTTTDIQTGRFIVVH